MGPVDGHQFVVQGRGLDFGEEVSENLKRG
jgi:hypothetical protein